MKEKKKLKGFTLIELIIVVAIFSIILALVMSFIDPVAKLMTKASTRERTAAYVDNIADYIDNSIHYSRFIRVYNGGFCSNSDSTDPITESEAVKALVEDMLDNAVDFEGNSIKGQARVLKLINTATTDCPVQGQVYESLYRFTTGVHIEDADDPSNIITKSPTSVTSSYTNQEIINDEHLQDYSYYYKTGFYTLNPLTDTDKYIDPTTNEKRFAAKNRTYYSRLNPLLYEKDHDGVVDDEFTMTHDDTMCNFCVNVVSYLKGNRDTAKYKDGAYEEDNITVFKSPANINSASMALVNVMQAQKSDEVICVWLDREADGTPVEENGKKKFTSKFPDEVKGNPYREFTASYADSNDNIYIVYISPDEIYDTEIVYTK